MQNTISHMKPGERRTVETVTAEGALRRKLLDMGLTPGVEVIMRKRAPLGDPLEIRIRGYELSLRKGEAEQVLTQPIVD